MRAILLFASVAGASPPGPAPGPSSSALLVGPELLIGAVNTVRVSGLPPDVEVYLLASQTGFGLGPCDVVYDLCTTLLVPSVLADAVTDGSGSASFDVDVDEGTPPAPVYLEVLAWNADSESGVRTNAIERHYTVPADRAAASFTEITAAAGLSTTYTWSNTHTGGAAFVDYNGDFWPDLFITNGGGEPHYLYRNDGDGTFTDVSYLVPKPDPGLEDAGVKFADLDNDGDSDIIVVVDNPTLMDAAAVNPVTGGPNLLYENQGDGTFVETAFSSGVVDPEGRRNSCGALADYDLDGFVDLYLGVWAIGSGPYVHDNRLLHNDGDGGFTEVADGPTGDGLDTLVVQWFDADLDGLPDLYVANVASSGPPPEHLHGDLLYRNDGVGFVDDTARSPGIGDDARAAMGMDVGDVDNDGDFDVYLTDGWGKNPQPTGGVLYLGAPDGTLGDNTCDVAGVCTGYHTWPANFADFDRDGWIDLRVGSTYPEDPDPLYINQGDGTFANHEVPAFIGNNSQGSAQADFDGDGDVDVFSQNRFMDSLLFANDGKDANNWLELKLIGTVSNRDAIGALVRLSANGVSQIRRVSGTDSAHSQSELIVHFGLGTATEAEVEVRWPGGEVQELGVVTANELVFVDESAGVLVETLVDGTVAYDAGEQALAVEVVSAFGGRTAMEVEGFGPLDWDVESGAFQAVFADVPVDPGSVTVRSRRGPSWVLPFPEDDPADSTGDAPEEGTGCGCATGGLRAGVWVWVGLILARRRLISP